MHDHIKIPDRRVPIELIRQEIHQEYTKDEGYDDFYKLFSIHIYILS